MVSSGTVTKDLNEVVENLNTYDSQTGNLGGSWKGPSYDSLSSQMAEVSGEYSSAIENGRTNFASACDEYTVYLERKTSLLEAQKAVQANQAQLQKAEVQADKDAIQAAINESSAKVEEYKQLMEESEKNIKAYLEAASSTVLQASPSIKGGVAIGGFVSSGDNVLLSGDLQGVVNIFGGQNDNSGEYPAGGELCDDYARGYCLYLQTGKVAPRNSVSTDGCGLKTHQINAKNRKEQAQIVYDRLVNDGKPSVIHIQSPTGKGHWVTVVGYRNGATHDSVKVDDFVIMDPANGKVRNLSEVSAYRSESGNYRYDPGFHINYYD